jgi:carbamoyl-phosphate synthase large subunit
LKSTILITSSGSKVPLASAVKNAAIRTMLKPNVMTADTNPQALSQYFSDEFWQMKPLQDYEDDELISELITRGIVFVIPTRDGELQRWARLKLKLREKGIGVLVSSENTLQYVLDKLQFSKWLEKNNFDGIETLEKPNFAENTKLVIKERYSNVAKNTIIGINQVEAMALSQNHSMPVFQKFIDGIEISVDVWIHDSGISTCFARTRDLIIDGEARVTTRFPNEELEQIALNMAKKLGIEGPAVIQFIRNSAGKFVPLECNARIGGASTFSISTQFDSLYVALCQFFHEPSLYLSPPMGYSKQVRTMKDYYF